MKLSKSQVDSIQKKNLANILRAQMEGKRLTVAEQNLINSMGGDEPAGTLAVVYAKNKVELASVLGVDRRTLNEWFKLPGHPRPGSNGHHDVGQWRAFRLMNGLKGSEGPVEVDEKTKRIRAQRERLEFQNAIMRGEYTKNDDLKPMLNRAARAFWMVIEGMPRKAAMTCAGRSPAEIEKVLEEFVQEAKSQISGGPWPKK